MILLLFAVIISISFVRGNFATRIANKRWRLRSRKTHSSLFRHEIYKILVTQKGILVFVFLAISQVVIASNLPPIGSDEFYYQNYMEQLSGLWNEDKEEFIVDEQERFNDLDQLAMEAQEKYNRSEISEHELSATNQYVATNKLPFNSFLKVLVKVDMMKQGEEKEQVLVYETGYNLLLGKSYFGLSNELIQISIFIACLIVLLTLYMAEEYETDMINIIKTTVNGRDNLISTKIILGLLTTIIMYIISFLPSLLMVNQLYPLNNLSAPLSSISSMDYVMPDLSISIGGYLSIIYIIRFVAAVCTFLLSYIVACKLERSNVAIALLTTVTVVPLLLRMLGFEWVDHVSLNAFYSGNILFNLIENSYAIIALIIPITLIIYSYRSLRQHWS